jgi:signal transduction histidine kinase/CheY-like chemotaxis protein
MLQERQLTKSEFMDMLELSQAGIVRMKTRVALMTGLGIILMLIFPAWIILSWYVPMITLDLLNIRIQKFINNAHNEGVVLRTSVRNNYFLVSWAESFCICVLAVAMSIYEGQIPHFIPYIILLCTSIYVATSVYQNAHLMIGHLILHNITLIFISVRDVYITYPMTDTVLWAQLFSSLIVAYFLADSYLFFHKIHLDRQAKSQEIDDARQHAESLIKQKSDLISAISHELRTPLNGILGFTQVIQTTRLTKKQHEYVELIQNSGKDLQLILSNILDSETLEQDRLQVSAVKTDVRLVLNRTLKFFETLAMEKGIDLELTVDKSVPDKILIDETRLAQCVSNLISNAVHYTQKGNVSINVATHSNKLLISVLDTGIGIQKQNRDRIFEKFTQEEQHKISQMGTGLGLWLVKNIAHAMNGEVSLLKTSDAGSEFLLSFDLVLVPDAVGDTLNSLQNKRILHIEDTETNLMLVNLWLQEQNVIVTEARTGKDAITLLNQDTYDIILCDLHLPDCIGTRLIKQIRTLQNDNANIPVIALTAQPEKVTEANASNGFNQILSKPVDQGLLIATLKQV